MADHSTVVDLGTGTGRFALAAARHCARVVAVDMSAAMLEHVRREAENVGASNVEVVQAGFLTYQHTGAPADAVFSRNALHQLPDFWKGIALHRTAEILRVDGVFLLHDLVYDFSPSDAPGVLEEWMSSASPNPTCGYTAEDFATHTCTEFSTYGWLCRTPPFSRPRTRSAVLNRVPPQGIHGGEHVGAIEHGAVVVIGADEFHLRNRASRSLGDLAALRGRDDCVRSPVDDRRGHLDARDELGDRIAVTQQESDRQQRVMVLPDRGQVDER